jgi:type IX secretion system PorP/SprF family membrane protein
MKSFKKLIIALLLLSSSAIFAQQESIFTFYRYQMNVVNPAYVGVDDKTIISSSIRNQWTGIEDAPETQAVAFGTSLGKNTGLGLSMARDKTFIEKQTFFGLDFSYKLKVTESTNLFLGIKAGGNFYDVNTAGLQTYNLMSDPALNSLNSFSPNVGIGALIKYKGFFMSLSVPRMLNTERAKNEDGFVSVATDRPHVYWSSGYDIPLDDRGYLTLKPSFFLRYVNSAPVSMDFNTMLNIDDVVEFGGTYRTDKAYAGLVNFKISKKLILGYAYEMSTRAELARARKTSEFLLSFEF